mmetsp:Transcript_72141/g.143078  ORF Transcript_72141/g.143078 Transcript_72141/m.143078 type:complete len:208 (+) Transcript_72141:959-1582(+)
MSFMILGSMLSLSYDLSSSTKVLASDIIFLAGPKKSSTFLVGSLGSLIFSALTPFMTHTPSRMSLTAAGGEPIPLIRSMSGFLIVSRAAIAAAIAGIASARSASHESLSSLAEAATFETAASSLATNSFLGSITSVTSLSMTTAISSVSFLAITRLGLSSISCSFIFSTASPAASSCASPLSYRLRTNSISLRFLASNVWNTCMSSR